MLPCLCWAHLRHAQYCSAVWPRLQCPSLDRLALAALLQAGVGRTGTGGIWPAELLLAGPAVAPGGQCQAGTLWPGKAPGSHAGPACLLGRPHWPSAHGGQHQGRAPDGCTGPGRSTCGRWLPSCARASPGQRLPEWWGAGLFLGLLRQSSMPLMKAALVSLMTVNHAPMAPCLKWQCNFWTTQLASFSTVQWTLQWMLPAYCSCIGTKWLQYDNLSPY